MTGNEQLKDHSEVLIERKRRIHGELPTSLKEQCFATIRSNSEFYMQLESCKGSNPFDQISNSLKTELLGNKVIKKWDKWVQLLVNKQLTSLNLALEDPGSVKELFLALVENQPQLLEFCWAGPQILTIDSITSNQHFASMQYLQIQNSILDDLGLQVIANHLKNLRKLKIQLNGVTASGILALSALDHLEEFIFESLSPESTMLYNLSLRLLPKLIVVGHGYVSFEDIIPLFVGCKLNRDFHVEFENLPTPTTLGLQQLILHNRVGVIPDGIKMPNVTSLCLWHPLLDFQPDEKHFCNVTELQLLDLRIDYCVGIINHLGPQIIKLALCHDIMIGDDEEGRTQVDRILQLCPNLEVLYISIDVENLVFASHLEPNVELQKLKVLSLNMVYADVGIRQYDLSLSVGLPRDVLVQLLSAPNLRQFSMRGVDFNDEESDAIISLIKNKQILQNLEEFEFDNQHMEEKVGVIATDTSEIVYTNQEIRERHGKVLDTIVRLCPRLIQYNAHSTQF